MLVSRRKFLSKELIAAASIIVSESERKIIDEFGKSIEKIKTYYQNTFTALSKIKSEPTKPKESPETTEEISKEDKEKYVEELQENLAGLIFYLSGVVLETPEHNKYIEVNFAAAYDGIATSYCDKIIELIKKDKFAELIFEAPNKNTLHRLVSELKKDIKKVAEMISGVSMVKRSKSDENIIWDEYTIEYKKDNELSSNAEMFNDAVEAMRDFIHRGKLSLLLSKSTDEVQKDIESVERRFEGYVSSGSQVSKTHFIETAIGFIRKHIEPRDDMAGKELYEEFRNILRAAIRYAGG